MQSHSLMIKDEFRMFVSPCGLVSACSLLLIVYTAMARPQTRDDIVTEATFDFKELHETRGYGNLVRDSREKAEFDKIVFAASQKRIGVWESYAIHGTLPLALKDFDKLYLELSSDISARLFAMEKMTGKIVHVPSFPRGRFTDRSIFLGGNNDGLLLLYTIVGGRMYTLLNPNGMQLRIYFRLVPDFCFPKGETDGVNNCAADSPPPVLPCKEPYFQDGWYVCTNFPSGFRHRKKDERLYLFLNSRTAENPRYCAYPVLFGQGNYFIDIDRWRYPDFMDKQWGPFGVYSATEHGITFDMAPPSRGELSAIRFYGAVSLGKPEGKIISLAKELINSEKIFSNFFPKWVEDGPDARKLYFSKTVVPGIAAENIRFLINDKEYYEKDQADGFMKIFFSEKEEKQK